MRRRHCTLAFGCLILLGSVPSYAQTGANERRKFDIPAQDLKYALRSVTRNAGFELYARSDDLRGKRSMPIKGDLTLQEALDELLAKTGLDAHIDGEAVFIRGRGEAAAGSQEKIASVAEIVVTGTHLKGVPVASPVITLTQQAMRDSGQTSIAQALSDLPQNFGGGQNPGVGLGVPGSQNVSGASTINLRGVGGDATLTLLDGHRLAYNANLQSIDISSIPYLAIDRVEIVADGSSALYGSDAVAGVANIIIKRDYEGITSDVRIGAATDGGDFQQQYGLLAGTRWTSGGIMAAYEFNRETAIDASDRSYSKQVAAGLTLKPYLKHHDGALSLHQELTNGLVFAIDVIGNSRSNIYHYAVDTQANYLLDGGRVTTRSTSFAISPSLDWTIGRGWSATLTGMHGLDHNRYQGDSFFNNTNIFTTRFCDCNSASSIEASANGPLFPLPAGQVKLALGGGYRSNRFVQTDANIHASDSVEFLYGETEIPLISPANAIPLVRRLLVTGAVRYEHYGRERSVATPKLGLVFQPDDNLTLKASWGRSFKAPTLFQQYDAVRVGLYAASDVGGTASSTSTALDLIGGSPKLKPERATSWSTSLAWKPATLPNLSIETSYFDIRYRDRVVTPITYETIALSDPIYAGLVNFSPTPAEIAQTVAMGPLDNITSGPFDPSSVVAIIDNRYVNAGRQAIHGIDVATSYDVNIGRSKLTFTGSATYLHSRQQLSPGQPALPLSGTLYNPPHYRARGGVVWNRDSAVLSAFANYIGGVRDERFSPSLGVSPMTTVDLNARYAPAHSGFLSGLEISLSVENVMDQKPSLISGTTIYEQPYDATNYSPVGRLISIGVTKHW